LKEFKAETEESLAKTNTLISELQDHLSEEQSKKKLC
jgi:hypothetical protein